MTLPASIIPEHIQVVGPLEPGYGTILSRDALIFVADLVRTFSGPLEALLTQRRTRQQQFAAGVRPHFMAETAELRTADWTVARIPDDLLDRRVEITGPVDRKMIINALNSGANVFMADFEDSTSPTWDNLVQGQLNLLDAVRGAISYVAPETGKKYALAPKTATLMVRPRGLHLTEKHLLVDSRPVPAALFDFGLFFFHNAHMLRQRGSGPYFYLPKLQSHLEARWWNDVFLHAQRRQDLPSGTIRATVLIETLPAAFEMDEILYALREHSAGLNCGRWDYIFSFIKTFRDDPAFVLPDRAEVTMTQPFMRAYTQLLIRTCHRRGIHAMGGMAAQIPIKGDPAANDIALEKVRMDKLREATDGHDGTWVAHPGLVPLALEVFNTHMPTHNQIHRKRLDVVVSSRDLIEVPQGSRTEAGLRHSIRVGLQYLEAWLRGNGCVPLYNLMEDAATAEICRSQVWQWQHHRVALDNGQPVSPAWIREVVTQELEAIRGEIGAERFASGRFEEARGLFEKVATGDVMEEFLTLPAYELLYARPPEKAPS